MRIKFLINVVVQNKGAARFAAGQVVDLPDDSANHWIDRGKAERVSEPKSKPETASVRAPEHAAHKPGKPKVNRT